LRVCSASENSPLWAGRFRPSLTPGSRAVRLPRGVEEPDDAAAPPDVARAVIALRPSAGLLRPLGDAGGWAIIVGFTAGSLIVGPATAGNRGVVAVLAVLGVNGGSFGMTPRPSTVSRLTVPERPLTRFATSPGNDPATPMSGTAHGRLAHQRRGHHHDAHCHRFLIKTCRSDCKPLLDLK
jgi:hypothetical protein